MIGRPLTAVARAGAVSDADAASFHSVRPRLLGIARRVLRTASEAEDVVQDTWIRWQGADRSEVRDAAAFLSATTTRLAINVTQSARARRQTDAGPWLLDPADPDADPALGADRRDALEVAVGLLVEKLSPAERAAYVLREAFDYPYREIAQVLGLGEANARQLVSRARRRLTGDHRRPVGLDKRERLLDAFVAAAQTGDLAALEHLLAGDVGAGGGRVAPATRLPLPRDAAAAVAA